MPPKAKEKGKGPEELAGQELLNYYKSRIGDFERERASMLEGLDKCAVQAAELHRLDWENRKRADEIRELQKALSDAHNFLFEERQRLLALQAENDELRLQEIEDRKRIDRLLNYGTDNGPGGGKGKQQQLQQQLFMQQQQQPSMDVVLLKVESLQAQLNEQKQLAAERIAALLEDRRIRETEEAAGRAQAAQQIEALSARVKKAEEQLRQTTKDYILARRDKQAAEEAGVEAQTQLVQERQRAAEEVSQLRRRAEREVREVRGEAESRLDDVSQNLRKQLKAKEEEVVNLASVHTAAKAQFDKRVAELETKVAKLTDSNRQLEARRQFEMEGWAADVTALRRLLMAVDRKLHEMRLMDRLEDDDRLDTILETLRRKAPDLPTAALSPRPGGGGGALPDAANVRDAGGSRAATPASHGGAPSTISDVSSVKGRLAKGLMQDIRSGIKGLEARLATTKRAPGR